MVTRSNRFQTLDDLRDYVNETLCQYDELEPGVFPLTERLLLRRNAPCAVQFCLHGPREVKLTAIWDMEASALLFYAPTGERFQKTALKEAPSLEAAND